MLITEWIVFAKDHHSYITWQFSPHIDESIPLCVAVQFEDILDERICKIIDTACSLCHDYGKVGFVEGIRIGIRLESELAEESTVLSFRTVLSA